MLKENTPTFLSQEMLVLLHVEGSLEDKCATMPLELGFVVCYMPFDSCVVRYSFPEVYKRACNRVKATFT